MAKFPSFLRAAADVSRRAVGFPALMASLKHLDDKIENVTKSLEADPPASANGSRSAGVPAVMASLKQLDDKIDALTKSVEAPPDRCSIPWTNCTYETIMGSPRAPSAVPGPLPLRSSFCKQGDFALDAYRYWVNAVRETPIFHRKQWEYFFIAQALHERQKLVPDGRGLGFGVGMEPLPALFASLGCEILATDQEPENAVRAGWVQTGQHTASLEALNSKGICDPAKFSRVVSFRPVDMNAIPQDLAGQFDFCWSTCSFEHLGSLEHGMRFVEESMKTLKPGGVAVHTTELNLSSNSQTLESQDLSIYRRRDIEDLIERLTRSGCQVEPVEWDMQKGFLDDYVDLPPFGSNPHIRLRLEEYDCTSIGLIIVKP